MRKQINFKVFEKKAETDLNNEEINVMFVFFKLVNKLYNELGE